MISIPLDPAANILLANIGAVEALVDCADDPLMRAEARSELRRDHVEVLVEHVLVRSLAGGQGG